MKQNPMWKPKYFFITFILLVFESGIARAEKIGSDGIIRRSNDGNVKAFDQYEALKACPSGMHLPTAREFALECQSRGAHGILEVGLVNPDTVPYEYNEIHTFNNSGLKDIFYFSKKGYRPPYPINQGWFWSSSVSSSDTSYGYAFNLVDCNITLEDRRRESQYPYVDDIMAVRCVADR